MRWMWIDKIIDFEPMTRLAAIKCVTRGEDQLDVDSKLGPVMPASLMIEGMAQTAGLLVGTAGQYREKVILAKIIRAEFDDEVRPGQTVRYEALLDRFDTAGAATSGTVHRLRPPALDWEPIGRVDLMFSHLDRNLSGRSFPEENFVFSDNFRDLLRDANIPLWD